VNAFDQFDAPAVNPFDQFDAVSHWSDTGRNEYGITADPQQFNKGGGVEVAQPVANVATAAAGGAKEGFGTEPLGLSSQSDDALARAGVFNGPDEYNPLKGINRGVIGGLVAAGDLALRSGNAILRGGQAAVAQAGEEVGAPILGRDLAALPEALIPESGGIPHAGVATAAEDAATTRQAALARAAENHTMSLEAPLPGAFRDNPGVTMPSMVGPTSLNPLVAGYQADIPAPLNPLAVLGQPAPVGAVSGPQSVGAAASRDLTNPSLIAMTPREAAASQATGESWRLAQPAVQGEDKTQYVKGVVPTAAETSGNADVAGEQKFLVQTPGMAEQNRLQQTRNNDARVDHFDNLAGTQTIVNTMSEARDAQAAQDLNAAWSNKKPVDAQPIIDQIDAVLAGPQGKLSAVKSALTSIRNTLHDADGNVESDPETLYGARREVANMLGKAAQVEKPTLKDAARQIGTIRDALDQTIERGAPGYRQYLENYSAASKPINARQLLLDARPDLTGGSERMMNFGKMDRLMKGIVGDRQAPGVNAAKSIDDDMMEGLWALHSDLKRQNNIDLGRPRGSDTSSLLRKGASMAGLGAAHLVANKVLPVVGPFMVKQGHEMMEKRQLQGRMNKLMDGMNFPTPKP
jgi:hypothetical protein